MHPLFLAVVLITIFQADQSVGTATGFFYRSGTRTYLVTSRHVVVQAGNVNPDRLRLRLHADVKGDLTANVDHDVRLYQRGRPAWHESRSSQRAAVDVVVVELDQQTQSAIQHIKPLTRDSFFPAQRLLIPPGEDVMIVGYPLGASDTVNNLPIVRHASVATAFGVNFAGEPAFFIDGTLQAGMSGSPVLSKPKLTWPAVEGGVMLLADPPVYLLGVYSGYVEGLAMGKVWYASTIEDIIGGIRP